AKALSPAKVKEVRINEDTGVAEVIVPDYQLSLAIGKEGQNARLSARLTGWRVDIKSETQLVEEEAYSQQDWAEGEWVVDAETGEQVWQPAEGGPAMSAEAWEAAVSEPSEAEAIAGEAAAGEADPSGAGEPEGEAAGGEAVESADAEPSEAEGEVPTDDAGTDDTGTDDTGSDEAAAAVEAELDAEDEIGADVAELAESAA